MTVRAAQVDDLNSVQAINAWVIEETTISFGTEVKSIEDFNAARLDGRLFVVTDTDDQVLGYASFFGFRSGTGYNHVAEFSIALDPAAQGKGLGPKLLSYLEDAARAKGIAILIGGVSSSNAQGQAFHASCGFEQVGYLPGTGRKFGETLDLLLYQKNL